MGGPPGQRGAGHRATERRLERQFEEMHKLSSIFKETVSKVRLACSPQSEPEATRVPGTDRRPRRKDGTSAQRNTTWLLGKRSHEICPRTDGHGECHAERDRHRTASLICGVGQRRVLSLTSKARNRGC